MKNVKLLSIAFLIACCLSINESNAYYEFVEIEGSQGEGFVVNVVDKKPVEREVNVNENEPIIYNSSKAATKQNLTKKYAASNALNRTTEQINNTNNEKEIFQETITKHENTKYYTNWSPSESLAKVRSIGLGLVSANGIKQSVNFTVTNDTEMVNATTSGDGTINIFTGILPFCESEDELAFIVGHELGHAASYHVAKTVVTNEVANAANQAGKKVAVSKIQGALKKSPIGGAFADLATSSASKAVDAATVAGTSKVGRVMEANADLLACDYMVKKGYNPAAAISILYKIGTNYPDLFSDHPSTDKRIAAVYEHINKNYPKYLKAGYNTEAYKAALMQLR